MKSPMAQTLKLMRSRGYHCEVTERWCPFSKRRKDLFGFCDVLCLRGDETVAIQTTTASHINARIEKMRTLDGPKWWLLSTTRTIVVHGWARRGERGKRKLSTRREVPVTAAKYLGCFKTETEAAERYDQEALKLRGEFAFLNDVMPRGKRKVWTCREVAVTPGMIAALDKSIDRELDKPFTLSQGLEPKDFHKTLNASAQTEKR